MSTTNGQPPANWYADPIGRHERRYWDGSDSMATPTLAETFGTTAAAAEFQMEPIQEIVAEAHRESAPAAEISGGSGPAAPMKVSFFGARKVAQNAQEENRRLQALVDKHDLRRD
jgi:hypothetical protein